MCAGIKTNRGSTNWYVVIGKMIIAGCQVHYVIQCDECYSLRGTREEVYEGEVKENKVMSRIYVTD